MRSFLAIILSFTILMQSASKLIIVAGYELNKDFISKNLCENKAKPKMHCNGKCHLKKQLEKEDKKENSGTNNLKEKFEIELISEKKPAFSFLHSGQKTRLISNYLIGNYSIYLHSVFHPPQA